MELAPSDIVPTNPLDLAARTLVFTPDGRGGYERSVGALAWEDDIYLLEPGQEPDQEQLRSHALFLGGTLDYWARITGGRSRLTTEFAGR